MANTHTYVPCPICHKRYLRKGRQRCWDCYIRDVGRSSSGEFKYKVDSKGCWVWQGSLDKRGYGTIYRKGLPELAHRASWVLHRGPIPDGMDMLHRCDNPPRVNPDHLFPGTQADNNRDRDSKMRHAHGEQSPHAKITESDALAIIRSSKAAKQLSEQYGICVVHVRNIRRGKKWAHLQSGVSA